MTTVTVSERHPCALEWVVACALRRSDQDPSFASDDDVPIPYMQRTRDYYRALGFAEPYRWAHFAEVPFHRLARPLRDARVTIVTTAAPFRPELGDQGPGAPYNGAAKFFHVYSGGTACDHDLRIAHIAYDREHTSADDVGTYFPLAQLRAAAAAGRIGALAPRFYGVPTTRSQRTTIEVDAPEVLRRCREDDVDAAVLVPNCPVCHQTVALTARHLEAHGIATVVLGCARDIVEWCGVPRFVFSDFPLGNGAGRPHDPASQALTLELALRLLETASAPRTTLASPLRWSEDAAWKADFMNPVRLSAEDVEREGRAFCEQKAIAKDARARLG